MFETMEPIELEHAGTLLRGYIARPDGDQPRPTVLVMHSGMGIAHKEVVEPAAKKLAALGYVAICTDMYGAHLEGAGPEGFGPAYQEFLDNPSKQRARTVAWFDVAKGLPYVDEKRIAALGFCYGGTTSLEMARSGADLRAAISYHGILTTYQKAQAGGIKGQIVIYTGGGDPWAPDADVAALRQEMIEAGHRDYQITLFGAADHGFTDKYAHEQQLEGLSYHELSSDISWAGTLTLLENVFR
ncbi:dienelactone hydrolase family protein [Novosphingobium sp. KN65.2]|uniref:dienelactone hydrolase family protein n=1 Tax=Novosphingobium sp. KN65.2 TaxID=1478134 RepID=UPI0005E7AA21|nr:dienelactone hydrolase family protein [Novosphingobium sp. KN65.2]CDO35864.1 conserved hypothetical protein [Novosphingobium sp. KN65.2]